jgi:hypothetical protein
MYELTIFNGNGRECYAFSNESINTLKIHATKKIFTNEIDFHAGSIKAIISTEKGEVLYSATYEYKTGKHAWKKEYF